MWGFGVSILGLRIEFAVVLGLCRVGIIYVFAVLFGLGFGILVLGVTCWVLGCVVVAGAWHMVVGCGGVWVFCFPGFVVICLCMLHAVWSRLCFDAGFVFLWLIWFCVFDFGFVLIGILDW